MVEAPPSPYGTPGPRVVYEEATGFGKRAWIVAGEPPIRLEIPKPAAPEEIEVANETLSDTWTSEVEGSVNGDADRQTVVEPESPIRASELRSETDMPEVRVLGRVEVLGWRKVPDRKVIPELVCFLALHSERNVPGEEIRAALWPGDLETTEASMKNLHNMVSIMRTCLGKEFVPTASKGSGYRLAPKVTTDWNRFNELVKSADGGGHGEIEALTSALELVRGAPFEGVAPGSYTWAWTELFVARMEVAIANAASRLAEIHIARGDADQARWATLQGLSASPYDRTLWKNFLTAAAGGSTGELDRAIKHLRSVLGDDAREFDKFLSEIRSGHPGRKGALRS